MEKILYLTLMYDFYAELLTDKQREVFEMYVLDDLSLHEIADKHGISRQAVNDLIKRTEKILVGYEEKLKLVDRHIVIGNKIDQISDLLHRQPQNAATAEISGMLTELKEI